MSHQSLCLCSPCKAEGQSLRVSRKETSAIRQGISARMANQVRMEMMLRFLDRRENLAARSGSGASSACTQETASAQSHSDAAAVGATSHLDRVDEGEDADAGDAADDAAVGQSAEVPVVAGRGVARCITVVLGLSRTGQQIETDLLHHHVVSGLRHTRHF